MEWVTHNGKQVGEVDATDDELSVMRDDIIDDGGSDGTERRTDGPTDREIDGIPLHAKAMLEGCAPFTHVCHWMLSLLVALRSTRTRRDSRRLQENAMVRLWFALHERLRDRILTISRRTLKHNSSDHFVKD
jgi:hypothetical protein